MSDGLFSLAEQLQGLNDALHQERRERPEPSAIRAELETHVGTFVKASRLEEAQIRPLFQNRALVGVDGSLNQVGGNYPFTVQLFKSLAKSTLKNRDGQTAIEKVALFSPLRSDDRTTLRYFIEEKQQELRVDPQEEPQLTRDLQEQQAYFLYIDQRMVELELEAAIEAMQAFDPYLMLMDGGFSRLKGKGADKWEQFREMALERNTIVVGVIEEVGSYRIQSRLPADFAQRFVRGHDREILFNTLEPGEWLKTSLDRPIKNDFYTVFTRLSDLPQAGACDFLREQAEHVDDVVDYLYTITPPKSRGIPLWLDVVDAEVRLTKKQIDLLVATNIDLENMESFLRPQRERRDF